MLVHLCLRMVTTIGGNSSDNRACFRETSRGKFPKLKQRLSRGRKAYIAAGVELVVCMCLCHRLCLYVSLVRVASIGAHVGYRCVPFARATIRILRVLHGIARVSSTMTENYGGLFAYRVALATTDRTAVGGQTNFITFSRIRNDVVDTKLVSSNWHGRRQLDEIR